MDEPCSALDPIATAQVEELIDELRENFSVVIVTHSMQQAINLGNRIIMMHRGNILHDIRAEEKRHLRVEDLLERFEDIRRTEQLDASAAELLRGAYV